jgi:hypothetical protein
LQKMNRPEEAIVRGPYAVDIGDGGKGVGLDDVKRSPDGTESGVKLYWEAAGEGREIAISNPQNNDGRRRHAVTLSHRPDGLWSLAGAMTTPMGGLFFFERIPERKTETEQAKFAAMVLSPGKNAGKPLGDRISASLSIPGTAFAAVLRETESEKAPSRLSATVPVPSRLPKEESENRFGFSLAKGRGADAGKILVMHNVKLILDIRANELVNLKGSAMHRYEAAKRPGSEQSELESSIEKTKESAAVQGGQKTDLKAPPYTFQSVLFQSGGSNRK